MDVNVNIFKNVNDMSGWNVLLLIAQCVLYEECKSITHL